MEDFMSDKMTKKERRQLTKDIHEAYQATTDDLCSIHHPHYDVLNEEFHWSYWMWEMELTAMQYPSTNKNTWKHPAELPQSVLTVNMVLEQYNNAKRT